MRSPLDGGPWQLCRAIEARSREASKGLVVVEHLDQGIRTAARAFALPGGVAAWSAEVAGALDRIAPGADRGMLG